MAEGAGKVMNVAEFSKLPLMGILRGIEPVDIEPLLETVISAGLGSIEITMNTTGASDIIEKAFTVANGRIDIGAGTVLTKDALDSAISSGASFIVLPVYVKEVVDACRRSNIPVFPGALTPSEVYKAWGNGATMVKVFPASMFPPRYFRELKAPFDDVKLMAVGGVRIDTIADIFSAGADAVAFGASVFKKEWLQNKDWSSIGDLVAEYVREVRRVVGT